MEHQSRRLRELIEEEENLREGEAMWVRQEALGDVVRFFVAIPAAMLFALLLYRTAWAAVLVAALCYPWLALWTGGREDQKRDEVIRLRREIRKMERQAELAASREASSGPFQEAA